MVLLLEGCCHYYRSLTPLRYSNYATICVVSKQHPFTMYLLGCILHIYCYTALLILSIYSYILLLQYSLFLDSFSNNAYRLISVLSILSDQIIEQVSCKETDIEINVEQSQKRSKRTSLSAIEGHSCQKMLII